MTGTEIIALQKAQAEQDFQRIKAMFDGGGVTLPFMEAIAQMLFDELKRSTERDIGRMNSLNHLFKD
jgi:shikimate 5-dehydrogenase